MDFIAAFALARQQRDTDIAKLEGEFASKLKDLGVSFGDGLVGNLASQVGYVELLAWRGDKKEDITNRYIFHIEGILFALTSK